MLGTFVTSGWGHSCAMVSNGYRNNAAISQSCHFCITDQQGRWGGRNQESLDSQRASPRKSVELSTSSEKASMDLSPVIVTRLYFLRIKHLSSIVAWPWTPPPPSDAYDASFWVHQVSSILPGPADPLMQHGLTLNNLRATTKTTQYRLVRRYDTTQDAFRSSLDSIKTGCSAVNILLKAAIALSHLYEDMEHEYVKVATQSISTTPYSASSHALGGLGHRTPSSMWGCFASKCKDRKHHTDIYPTHPPVCALEHELRWICNIAWMDNVLSRLRCSALDIILPTRRILSEYQPQAKIIRLLARKITLIRKTSRRKDLISDRVGMEERKRRQWTKWELLWTMRRIPLHNVACRLRGPSFRPIHKAGVISHCRRTLVN